MALFREGALGSIRGSLGNMVVASYKGVPYLRQRPAARTTAPSQKELNNRRRWQLTQQWLQPVMELVREGFRGYSARAEGFVAAKSYLLKHALEGEADTLRINPALAKVSCGDLPLPATVQAALINGHAVQFTWDATAVAGTDPYDQAMLLAYNIEERYAVMRKTAQFRSIGQDVLVLPEAIEGLPPQTYHLYIAFIAVDRSRQSNSTYLGSVIIA
jgi:hypothetical protein